MSSESPVQEPWRTNGSSALNRTTASRNDIHPVLTLVAELPSAPESDMKAAVLTNLVDVLTRGEAGDFERTAALARQFGHQQVAAIHGEVDGLLRSGANLPLTSAAITTLARAVQVEEVLLRAGRSVGRSRQVATECAGAAFWLLMVDIDPMQRAPLPATPSEFRLVVERGGADLWRRILANIAVHPWGPVVARLEELARAADLEGPARAIDRCAKVYRERVAESERREVAKEIRRLVAVSGRTQRQFAQYVGTSAPRLSTYGSGIVTPSAAMMLRISMQSAVLARQELR